MIDKDKIKEINSRRKPTKGFTEEEIITTSKKAYETIMRNKKIASIKNASEIYKNSAHLSISYSNVDFHNFIYQSSTDNIPGRKSYKDLDFFEQK